METTKIYDIVKSALIGKDVEFLYDKELIQGTVIDVYYTNRPDSCHDGCSFYIKLDDDCNEYPFNALDEFKIGTIFKLEIEYTKSTVISQSAPTKIEFECVDGRRLIANYRYGRLKAYYPDSSAYCEKGESIIFDEMIGEEWDSSITLNEIKTRLEQNNIYLIRIKENE